MTMTVDWLSSTSPPRNTSKLDGCLTRHHDNGPCWDRVKRCPIDVEVRHHQLRWRVRARFRFLFTSTTSRALCLRTSDKRHAEPTAPAPTIPTFMVSPLLIYDAMCLTHSAIIPLQRKPRWQDDRAGAATRDVEAFRP